VDAGFEVVGVDIDPQPKYPFRFIQVDAIEFLSKLIAGTNPWYRLEYFDATHASPPCQAFTNAQKIQKNEHPDLITPTRDLLKSLGKPYIIENVPGAPLKDPIELCGAMFGLGTYRHRLFESNVNLEAPEHPVHVAKTAKMGRKPQPGEFMHIVGNFSGVAQGREVMGMPWATRDGLREAIPPAYTEYLGKQLLTHLELQEVAHG
jgi:DNA (cytosine-5)-methyltransferase 1